MAVVDNQPTQPDIPSGLLNRALAIIGWGKGSNVTSAGCQVTLCDSILQGSHKPAIVDEFYKPGKVWEFEVWSGKFFYDVIFFCELLIDEFDFCM